MDLPVNLVVKIRLEDALERGRIHAASLVAYIEHDVAPRIGWAGQSYAGRSRRLDHFEVGPHQHLSRAAAVSFRGIEDQVQGDLLQLVQIRAQTRQIRRDVDSDLDPFWQRRSKQRTEADQQIVEVVGTARREHSEALEFLDAKHLRRELLS